MSSSAALIIWVLFFGTLFVAALTQLLIAFYFRRTRFLSLSPRVWAGTSYMVAKTSRLTMVLTLGLLSRSVTVDRNKQSITIRSRVLWFVKRARTIPFSHIEKITYGYSDVNPITSLGLTGDTLDSFSVGLRLTNRDTVHIFNFYGGGTFEVGWTVPSWLEWTFWWERLTDLSGTQEEDSKSFVEKLRCLIGVEIGPR